MLDQMRANPNGWRIKDVESVCRALDIRLNSPTRGSHYKVSDPTMVEILTIPAQREIKPVYIRRLVDFIDAVRQARSK